jgi:hypothetical protein
MKQPRTTRKFMQAEPNYNVVDAMNGLFARWFDDGECNSWDGWRAILKAAFGLPMTQDEVAFFLKVAARRLPKRRVRELWIIAGRRAGKDSIASLIATFASVFFQAGLDKLRPGEKAVVSCIACDRDQAKIVLGLIKSFFEHIPPLGRMVMRQTRDGLELENDVSIEVGTNSFKSVRGRSFLVSILDEVAFYSTEEHAAKSDIETYNAIKPGLATLPGSMLIGISSPYRKSGLLYTNYKKFYGVDDDDILVIKAPTDLLNPTIDPAIISRAFEDDPQVARAEWGAEFRDDISGFIDADVVAACIMPGVRELPPAGGIRYFGFVDPSGGSGDAMTLAVAHRDGDKVIVDCLRERRPPFSPDDVVVEFAATLKSYWIGTVQGDRYGGEWPRERFRVHGVTYEPCEQTKSDLYVNLLPALNATRIALLDYPRLTSQLVGLERRTARSGKDSIDHQPSGHDDLCNAVAGACMLALRHQGVVVTPELLAKAMAMPINPNRRYAARHGAWRNQQAYMQQMMVPREKQGYPASFLPAERQWLSTKANDEGESR